jgi:hypothetical protein
MNINPPPAISANPIDRLPAELLERVLLDVVADTPSLIVRNGHRQKIVYRYEVFDGVSETLAFRSTSRRFRNLSWRALAKVIGETIFDLPSMASIENLKMISATAQLTPWITKLVISCHGMEDPFPNSGEMEDVAVSNYRTLTDEICQEVQQLRKHEQVWHPDLWTLWPKHLSHSSTESVAQLSHQRLRKESLEKQLASYFDTFTNLECLSFHHEPHALPGRYHKPFRVSNRGLSKPSVVDGGTRCGLSAHLGLDIFMSALNLSGIFPEVLELAVDLDEHHAFITNVPEAYFEKACSKVKTLRLYDAYCPFYEPVDMGHTLEPRVTINRFNFPALWSLTIDHKETMADPFTSVAPFPPLSELPQPAHLTILNSGLYETSMLSFIKHYGCNLQSLTVKHAIDGEYKAMLALLAELAVDHFEVEHGTDQEWSNYFNGKLMPEGFDNRHHNVLENLPEDLVQSAAKTVVFFPLELDKVLKRHWAGDVAIPPGLG